MMMKTLVSLDDTDVALIEEARRRWGLPSRAAAIRFLVRKGMERPVGPDLLPDFPSELELARPRVPENDAPLPASPETAPASPEPGRSSRKNARSSRPEAPASHEESFEEELRRRVSAFMLKEPEADEPTVRRSMGYEIRRERKKREAERLLRQQEAELGIGAEETAWMDQVKGRP